MLRAASVLLAALLLSVIVAACSGDGGDTRPGTDVVAVHDTAEASGGDDTSTGTDGTGPGPDTAVDPAVVWTDPFAGLQWQRVAPEERMPLDVAATYCEENQAGLPGLGWHVPSIDELRTLIVGCPASESGGACGVTEECLDLTGCWSADCWSCAIGEGPADGCYRDADLAGDCGATWSIDPVGDQGGRAWFVNFQKGGVHHDLVTNASIVRCVRWQ